MYDNPVAGIVRRAAYSGNSDEKVPQKAKAILSSVRRIDSSIAYKYLQVAATIIKTAENVSLPITSSPPLQISAVMIKPVSDSCNLACNYCYEGLGRERFNRSRMDLSVLQKILFGVFENKSSKKISFVWHGGEPLLAGLDWFKAALELQKSFTHEGWRITNSVQTNGTLLSDEWLDFFEQNRFHVGVSFDGLPDLHGIYRIDHSGKASTNLTLDAIARLQKRDISYGVIVVLTNRVQNRAKEMLKYLSDIGVKQFDVHPSYGSDQQQSGLNMGRKEFAHFIEELFEAWLDLGDSGIAILTFDEFFRFILGEKPAVCYNQGQCKSIIAVEANGDVVPCTRPFDRGRYTFGNVLCSPWQDILQGDVFSKFVIEDIEGQQKTNNCRWFGLCHNGCPQHRKSNGVSNVSGLGTFCGCHDNSFDGYYRIWDYFYKRCLEIVSTECESATRH